MVMTVLYIGGSRDTLRLVPAHNHRAGEPGQTRLTRGAALSVDSDFSRCLVRLARGGLGFRLGLALGLSILDSSRFRLSSFSGFGRVYRYNLGTTARAEGEAPVAGRRWPVLTAHESAARRSFDRTHAARYELTRHAILLHVCAWLSTLEAGT